MENKLALLKEKILDQLIDEMNFIPESEKLFPKGEMKPEAEEMGEEAMPAEGMEEMPEVSEDDPDGVKSKFKKMMQG